MTSPSDPAARMTEKQLQADVIKLGRLLNYAVYHTYDSRRSVEGFPDLVLAWSNGFQRRVIFAELKTEQGRLSLAQARWCSLLDAYVWRPSDWINGAIERVLKEAKSGATNAVQSKLQPAGVSASPRRKVSAVSQPNTSSLVGLR